MTSTYPKKTTVMMVLDSINELNNVYTTCKRFCETETRKGILPVAALDDFSKALDILNASVMKSEIGLEPNVTVDVVAPNTSDPVTVASGKKHGKRKNKKHNKPSGDATVTTDANGASHAWAEIKTMSVGDETGSTIIVDNTDTTVVDDTENKSDDSADVTDCNNTKIQTTDAAACTHDEITTVVVDDNEDKVDKVDGRRDCNLLRLHKTHSKHKVKRQPQTKSPSGRTYWGKRTDEEANKRLLDSAVEAFIDGEYKSIADFNKDHNDMRMAMWHRRMGLEFINTLESFGVEFQIPRERRVNYQNMVNQNPLL